MSLATRCTACGTIFRIVEDQLRVSDGWVRCGRCAEIFDARELLFDIERETPPAWPAAYMPPVATEPPAAPPPPVPPPPPPEPIWAPPPEPAPPAEPRMEAPPDSWPDEPAGDRQEPRWVDEHAAAAPVAASEPVMSASASADKDAPPLSSTMAAPPPAELPEFMRQARKAERWNRPAVRIGLAVASVGLAALLLLQVALHFRHALAALHPPMRGMLQALCAGLGCEVQPWQRIEALNIESHTMTGLGGNNYQLTLVLSNKTAVDVAAPWVELKLTDAQGAPFARRALAPALLNPPLRQIGANSEQTLTFSFSTAGQPVSGYAVGVFHP